MSAPVSLSSAPSAEARRAEIARLLALAITRCRRDDKPAGWTQKGVANPRVGSVHVRPFKPGPTQR